MPWEACRHGRHDELLAKTSVLSNSIPAILARPVPSIVSRVSRHEADAPSAGAGPEERARVIGERLHAETVIPTRNYAFVPRSVLCIPPVASSSVSRLRAESRTVCWNGLG